MSETKPKVMPVTKNGCANLMLSEAEITAMLDIFLFAKSAAALLAQQQLNLGPTGIESATRLTRMASDAKELMRIVTVSLEVGEPETDDKH